MAVATAAAAAILLLLGSNRAAVAQEAAIDDSQCSADAVDGSRCAVSAAAGLGWRANATHATTACNMPVLEAGGELSSDALVQRLVAATTPLLIRGLLDLPEWASQAGALGNRSALLAQFGDEQVQLSVATLLSHGPESTTLDDKKLSFMREVWSAEGGSTTLSDTVERQVRAGEARPRVRLADWLSALRDGTAPTDAYVFQNISRGPIAQQALGPLHELWQRVAFAQFAQRRGSPWVGADPPALTRLGVGGSGSGAPFHDHDVVALNVAFAGRRRWLVTRPCSPHCRIPFRQGGAAVYHPEALLTGADELPSAALEQLAPGEDTWDCTQHPGEVVFLPEGFLHATINLDESVAVAVQCDDGSDPRVGFAELNALIVHANEAAAPLGPCGIPWESPFSADASMGARKALGILEALPDSFRGDPKVYLNRPTRDSHVPVDVAVQFGSKHVASALAAHGARFLPRHLVEAQERGHAALAAFLEDLLAT